MILFRLVVFVVYSADRSNAASHVQSAALALEYLSFSRREKTPVKNSSLYKLNRLLNKKKMTVRHDR